MFAPEKMGGMRILKVLTLIIGISLLTVACGGGGGGGGGGGEDNTSAPAISNLQYPPKSPTVNQGGESASINISIDFIDADGDIDKLTVHSNSGSDTIQLMGFSGVTKGTIQAITIVNTTEAGRFSFEVQVTDATDKLSNILTGSFHVSQ